MRHGVGDDGLGNAPAGHDVILPVRLELVEVNLPVTARVKLLHGVIQLRLGEKIAGHLHQRTDLLAVEGTAPILYHPARA